MQNCEGVNMAETSAQKNAFSHCHYKGHILNFPSFTGGERPQMLSCALIQAYTRIEPLTFLSQLPHMKEFLAGLKLITVLRVTSDRKSSTLTKNKEKIKQKHQTNRIH